jgi:hypothetical protein
MVQKIRSFFQKHKNLILLLGFTIVLHKEWFDPSSSLFFGDWSAWSDSSVVNMPRIYQMWVSFQDFSQSNIQPNFIIFQGMWWLLSLIGINSYNATKLTIFIPIALLSVISPYIYFLYKTKNTFISFVVTLFYSTTTYFLLRSQGGHSLIAFMYALVPLFFWLLEKSILTQKSKYFIWFSLVFSIMLGYEVRISYIIVIVALVYILFHFSLKQVITKKLWIPAILIPLLNLYWILPIVFSNSSSAIAKVANRGLFGNKLFSLLNAISLGEYAWTGSFPNNFFDPQPIPPCLFVIPIVLVYLVYLMVKARKITKELTFFILLSLVGILLTKQSDQPFPWLYEFLYKNVPTFNLFREASKFYVLIAFGYAGIMAIGLKFLVEESENVKKKSLQILKIGSFALILFVSLINVIPVFNGSIGGLFNDRPEIADYTKLNSYLGSQQDFFRTVWVPSFSSYGEFSDIHPIVSSPKLLSIFKQDESKEYIKNVESTLQLPQFASFLKDTSIKYFVLPVSEPDRDNAPFSYYGGELDREIRSEFMSLLDKQDYLERVQTIGLENVILYKVKNFEEGSRYRIKNNAYQIDTQEIGVEASGILGSYFDNDVLFEESEKQSNLPKLSKLFGKNAIQSSQTSNIISTKLDKKRNLLVYAEPKIYYLKQKNELSIYSKFESNVSVDGEKIEFNENKVVLYEKTLENISAELTLKYNETYIPIVEGEKEIGLKNGGKIELFETKNVVLNENFEKGLWGAKVGDCSNYDNNAEIAMNQGFEPTNKYLELYAKRHTACTQKTTSDLDIGLYKISLDAKDLTNTKPKAKYFLGAQSDEINTFSKSWNTDYAWQTFNDYIKIDTKSSYNIFLYASENDDKKNGVGYDNVTISKLTPFQEIIIGKNNIVFKDVPVSAQSTVAVKKNNLINRVLDEKFDNGLWSKNLGDCLNYDNNPIFSQSIVKENKNNFLELKTKRHFPCTTKELYPIDPNRMYLYNFDVRVKGTTGTRSYISNSEDKLSKLLETTQKENLWQTQTYWGSNKLGLKGSVAIGIYGTENNEKTEVVTQFDNVQFFDYDRELDSIFILDEPKVVLSKTTLDEQYIDSTSRKLNIATTANYPIYIINNEEYNTSWELMKPSGLKAQYYNDNRGFGFWKLDQKDLCDSLVGCKGNATKIYSITFASQKYFVYGLGISGISLSITIIILIYVSQKKNLV